ncbi:hypothetical protein K438DRAFT_1747073 [Mycena galopus ATCC 62051]|nr:hypothetical protein K438DRAFT_1747073 [Mycena galopus ATCC 62051]
MSDSSHLSFKWLAGLTFYHGLSGDSSNREQRIPLKLRIDVDFAPIIIPCKAGWWQWPEIYGPIQGSPRTKETIRPHRPPQFRMQIFSILIFAFQGYRLIGNCYAQHGFLTHDYPVPGGHPDFPDQAASDEQSPSDLSGSSCSGTFALKSGQLLKPDANDDFVKPEANPKQASTALSLYLAIRPLPPRTSARPSIIFMEYPLAEHGSYAATYSMARSKRRSTQC